MRQPFFGKREEKREHNMQSSRIPWWHFCLEACYLCTDMHMLYVCKCMFVCALMYVSSTRTYIYECKTLKRFPFPFPLLVDGYTCLHAAKWRRMIAVSGEIEMVVVAVNSPSVIFTINLKL